MKILKSLAAPAVLLVLHLLFAKLFSVHQDLYADLVFLAGSLLVILHHKSEIKQQNTLKWSRLLSSIAIGFAYSAALALAAEALPGAWQLREAVESPANFALTSGNAVWYITMLACNPLAEETAFRLFQLNHLRNAMEEIPALLLCALCSAVYGGLRDGIYGALFAGFTGFLFGLLQEESGSFWCALGAHSAAVLGILMSYAGIFLNTTICAVLACIMILSALFLLMHFIHHEQ